MHGDIAFHGCEYMVEIKHHNWWLISGLGTVGQSSTRVARFHDIENLCRVIVIRARHSLE